MKLKLIILFIIYYNVFPVSNLFAQEPVIPVVPQIDPVVAEKIKSKINEIKSSETPEKNKVVDDSK